MKVLISLFIVVLFSGCAKLGYVEQGKVYQLYGMLPMEGEEATDGIYQDFSHHNGNLAHYWFDTDAVVHDGDERARIKPWVDRMNEKEPFMRVEYDRQGYGAGVSIAAKGNVPERITEGSKLIIVMRSQSDACIGVKIQELDGEVWFFGKPKIDYYRQCLEPGSGWNQFEIPLTEDVWTLSPYGGNSKFGNKKREYDGVATISLALGSWGKYWFAPGANTLDIKSIEIR